VGGALDPDFNSESEEFPVGADGKPTYLPGAGWYLKRLDFNNAIRFEMVGKGKVSVSGDDVILAARFEGQFIEPMELRDFPFDVQDLTVSLAINCRTTGMTPAHFVLAEDGKFRHVIRKRHFKMHNEWKLRNDVRVGCHLVGTQGRYFPTIDIACTIERLPGFYLINVLLPMLLFALMANFQFAIPRYDTADRFSVSLPTPPSHSRTAARHTSVTQTHASLTHCWAHVSLTHSCAHAFSQSCPPITDP
jgi:hypothetical protein